MIPAMGAILTYNDEDDQKLYVHYDKTPRIVAATVASSPQKLNEDAFAAAFNDDTLVAGLFDGVTSLKPIAALKDVSGARFASHYLKNALHDCDLEATTKDILDSLNEKLLSESKQLGGDLSDTHSLPATTATIMKLRPGDETFSFAHVGDSISIVFYTDGSSEIFTDDKNAQYDERMLSLISEIAREQSISPREARDSQHVKDSLVDMYVERNNNPDGTGSGLVNGDPNMNVYIQTGERSLTDVHAILLASDGLVPPGWSITDPQDRTRMLQAIQDGGFEKLFELKHQAEDDDPDWHHLRYKHSDDATGLLILL